MTTQDSNTNLASFLDILVQRQQTWNDGSRRISKRELYGILAGCLELYETVKQGALYSKLEEELSARNLKFNSSTSVITRIVRCVFNTDERGISAFCSALTIATREEVKSGDLAKWLSDNGGIDRVRRNFKKSKSDVLSTKELYDIATNHLRSAPALAVISKSNLRNAHSSNSGFILNISRFNANGDCEVVATTADSTAIRHALTNWGRHVSAEKLLDGLDNDIRKGVSALAAAVAA